MITSSDYQNALNLLDLAQASLARCLSLTVDASAILTTGGQNNVAVTSTYGALRNMLDVETSKKNWYRFLSLLQEHVAAEYGSVSAFVSDHSITVPASVAQASVEVGYAVPANAIG